MPGSCVHVSSLPGTKLHKVWAVTAHLPNIFTFCFYHPTGSTTSDTGAKRRNEEVTLPFHRAWPCKAHTWCYPGAVIRLPGAEPSNTHSDITAWWMERLSPTISSTEEASAFCTPHSSTPSSSHSPAHTSQDISLNTFGMSDKLRTQVFVSLVTAGHLHLRINKSKKKLGPTCSCCKPACTV